jgi:hypothetical protein
MAQDSLRLVHAAEVVDNVAVVSRAVVAADQTRMALLTLDKVRAAAEMAARMSCKLPPQAQTREAAAEGALRTQVIPAARAVLES